MRKEWIRSEEECSFKRIKRLQKRKNLPSSSCYLDLSQSNFSIENMNEKSSSSNLTTHDWSLINSLSDLYDRRAFIDERKSLENYSIETSTLIDFFHDEQIIYRNLIEFYKQIPLFEKLHVDDQMLLIKSNLTHLVHLHHVLRDHFEENPRIGFLMSKWISRDFHQQMSKTRHSLDYFIQHPMVLKISLLVFIFLTNLSRIPRKEFSIDFLDRYSIVHNQNIFITLLWKYLHVIYDEQDARKAVQLIIFQYLRYQLLISDMEMVISNRFHPNQFPPLTQSLLHLT